MTDPKRKAVRVWAVWWPEDPMPVAVGWTRKYATRLRKERYGAFPYYKKIVDVVRVEIRPVAPKKRSKKRGR